MRNMDKQPETSVRPVIQEIDPDQYRMILAGLKLLDIELIKCSMVVKSEAGQQKNAKRAIAVKEHAEYSALENGIVLIDHCYELRGKENKRAAIDITITCRVVLQSEHAFSDDFFAVYKDLNLTLHTWPYVRELASSLTCRTRLPRLTLPLLVKS